MDNAERQILPRETIDSRVARWSAAQHGVFTRADAVRLGATLRMVRWRVEAGEWEQLYPGVYRTAGAPETWRQRLLAACLSSAPGAAASHRAAGGVIKLAGVEPGVLEISVLRGNLRHRSGVSIHEVSQLPSVDVTVVDAIPVTTPTRTLIDLAAVVSVEVLEEALDDALRRRLTTIARLRWRLDNLARRGRGGITAIRKILDARNPGAAGPQSPLETRVARLIRRAGLPEPVRQYHVRDGNRLIAVVDFAYPEVKVAVEADGYRWHSGRAQWERDLSRRNRLASLGWQVIHVTAADLRRPDDVVAIITAALARAGYPSCSREP